MNTIVVCSTVCVISDHWSSLSCVWTTLMVWVLSIVLVRVLLLSRVLLGLEERVFDGRCAHSNMGG
jgi:hypothetical protein